MTKAALSPDREEVDRIAKLLAKEDADSRHALRHYLAGDTEWDMAMPIIRRRISALINDKDRQLRRDVRLLLLGFAATYGLRVRLTASGDEPLSERIPIRVTPTQKDDIAAAAKAAGMDLVAWAREVLVREARKGQQAP